MYTAGCRRLTNFLAERKKHTHEIRMGKMAIVLAFCLFEWNGCCTSFELYLFRKINEKCKYANTNRNKILNFSPRATVFGYKRSCSLQSRSMQPVGHVSQLYFARLLLLEQKTHMVCVLNARHQTSALIFCGLCAEKTYTRYEFDGCSSTMPASRMSEERAVCGNSLAIYETERRNQGKLKFHYKMLITYGIAVCLLCVEFI